MAVVSIRTPAVILATEAFAGAEFVLIVAAAGSSLGARIGMLFNLTKHTYGCN